MIRAHTKLWAIRFSVVDGNGLRVQIESEPLEFKAAKKLQNRLFDSNGVDSYMVEVCE